MRRLGAAVTAVFVAVNIGLAVDAAELNLEELGTIAAYLEANDVEGLREYLTLRPELLEGDSDLAVLLREFIEQSRNLAGFLGMNEGSPGVDDSDETWAQDVLRRIRELEIDAADLDGQESPAAPQEPPAAPQEPPAAPQEPPATPQEPPAAPQEPAAPPEDPDPDEEIY